MYFNNLTLNMMTLGGLALGMGMLVDNSIVVLENIFRLRTMGHSKFEAARLGASEVGMAIIASTFTTIAVFLPIAFMEGITSMIFKELALTVSFSLIASLVVALTVVPMLASQLINVKSNNNNEMKLSKFEKYFEKLKRRYYTILKSALNHKIRTVIISVVIFVVSIGAAASLGGVFLPEVDEGSVNVQIELPVGYSLESTEDVLSEFMSSIEDIEDIDYIFESLGGADIISFGNRGDSSNTATLYILLKDKSDREHTAQEVADKIRTKTENIPGANIVVSATESSGFGGSTSPIEIAIRGDEIDEINRISKEVVEVVKGVKGTREVATTYEDGKEELRVVINREMASKYGLTAYTIGKTVREAVNGVTASKYKIDGSEYDITVKSQEYLRENLSNFKNILISTPAGIKIPVEYVADIYIDKGPIFIERMDQVRTIRVTSAIFGRDLRSISQDIEAGLEGIYFPNGYSYKIGGMNEELNSAFKNLGLAILLAIVLVYMVMASQFESFAHPFIIMFAVPLAIAGGGLGLFITRNPVSVPALIGGIMLTGIVVNNGIVLIDYTNHLKKNEGISYYEALLMAGPTRLRPILMTTLTTVLGLLPLALGIGEGSEAIEPLAIVVVFGLLIATMLTLVFVPVLLLIFVGIKEKFSKKFLKDEVFLDE
jgi:HAE1 family hydrophobic/amphiphilic exporter-1